MAAVAAQHTLHQNIALTPAWQSFCVQSPGMTMEASRTILRHYTFADCKLAKRATNVCSVAGS